MEYVVEIKSEQESGFSYERLWAKQEPQINPHKKRALELGVHIDDVPVSPALTRLADSVRRIETMFDAGDLADEHIDVRAMLSYMTEQQAIDAISETGVEPAITVAEIESLLYEQEYDALLSIPFVRHAFSSMRQMEETPSGKVVDVSAFSTIDYLRDMPEFDAYRYFLDKTAERAKDIAIMYSCLSTEEGKKAVLQRFVALVNSKFRNRGLALARICKESNDREEKIAILSKIDELNRNIRRMKSIWKKYSAWK